MQVEVEKISSLSAVQDDNKLYILLEGTEITVDIYIDSDSQTGMMHIGFGQIWEQTI